MPPYSPRGSGRTGVLPMASRIRCIMREDAQAVIIGGGVAGCSIAYHLTLMGWRDIVVVERGELTGGSTHRAAGLIGQLRGTHNLTRMIMYSVELYSRLRQETGLDPDWRQVGSLRLASSPLRMEEIRRLVAQAKAFGLEVELLTPREAKALCPIIVDRDLVGGAYIPSDGRIDPSGLAYALANGARSRGCEFQTQTDVTGIDVRDGRVHAVATTHGTIRIPALNDVGIRKLMIGPEVFTPDGDFLLGESAEVRGFYIAGGTPGIAAAGGVGKAMAEWIIEGRPSLDLWRADIRRFGSQFADRVYATTRAVEVYARNYTVHLPLEEFESARPLRTSPPYPRLVTLGAVFGEKAGWERPNWCKVNEVADSPGPTPTGWVRHNWSPAIPAEHAATRTNAGIFDFCSFSKFEVQGRGALGALQWLTDNDLDKPVGAVTYTQMLNPR